MNNAFKWAGTSMVGCMVASQVGFSLPLWVVFAIDSNSNGQLTLGRAVHIAIVTSLAGLAFGALFWVTWVKPLRERLKSKGMLREPQDRRR
ncbi:hypothetical protein [Nevskia soli]|uniref:hypothetical protein n=1 Tax=Nevskia soli TaxID=418856 RepID=UPI0012F8EFCE|nr:hypothetical protein [Nevskia soli]